MSLNNEELGLSSPPHLHAALLLKAGKSVSQTVHPAEFPPFSL